MTTLHESLHDGMYDTMHDMIRVNTDGAGVRISSITVMIAGLGLDHMFLGHDRGCQSVRLSVCLVRRCIHHGLQRVRMCDCKSGRGRVAWCQNGRVQEVKGMECDGLRG